MNVFICLPDLSACTHLFVLLSPEINTGIDGKRDTGIANGECRLFVAVCMSHRSGTGIEMGVIPNDRGTTDDVKVESVKVEECFTCGELLSF